VKVAVVTNTWPPSVTVIGPVPSPLAFVPVLSRPKFTSIGPLKDELSPVRVKLD